MEILRLPNTTSIQASFTLSPNTLYTIYYDDVILGDSFSASATSNASGVVIFTLNSRYLTYSGNLEALIYNGTSLVYSTGINVLRPYCDINAAATDLGKTTSEIIKAESIARMIIESEVGPFLFVRKEKEVSGMGLDYLPINEKIQSLYMMYENGELIHDSSDEDMNLYKISVDKSSIIPIDVIHNKIEYPKVWRDRYLDAAFANGYDYLIDADFGYRIIPEDIQKACYLLVKDIVNNSMEYINKYIELFDNTEYRVQFAKGSSSGTGNLTVDKILSPYKNKIVPGVI
jgi:hypothetical protein